MNGDDTGKVAVPGWLIGAAAIAGAWYFLRKRRGAVPGLPGPAPATIPGMPAPEGGPAFGATAAQVAQQDFSGQVAGGGIISDPFAPPQQVAQQTQSPRMSGNTNSVNWKYSSGQAPRQAGMYEDLSGLM